MNFLQKSCENRWNIVGDFETELFPARTCGGGVYFYLSYWGLCKKIANMENYLIKTKTPIYGNYCVRYRDIDDDVRTIFFGVKQRKQMFEWIVEKFNRKQITAIMVSKC